MLTNAEEGKEEEKCSKLDKTDQISSLSRKEEEEENSTWNIVKHSSHLHS